MGSPDRIYDWSVLRGLSLAKKCLLLFGAATVFIVLVAMMLPWLRMNALIDQGQLELSRQMMANWERYNNPNALIRRDPASGVIRSEPWQPFRFNLSTGRPDRSGVDAREFDLDGARANEDPFVRRAIESFIEDPSRVDYQEASWAGTERIYRYAKAVHRVVRDPAVAAGVPLPGATPAAPAPAPAGEGAAPPRPGELRLVGMVELKRPSVQAGQLLLLNTTYVLGAGAFVLCLAMLVFWLITRKLVLRPVRQLTVVAERVREGGLNTRAELDTGDEFQQLGETINSMLNDLQAGQDRLRAINAALDVKLNELAEANNALYQSAKAKGEFLASVSHELRTPLNSINGFAELLLEVAKNDAEAPDPAPTVLKRIRYLENILTAGRGLLALINSLLEMARIEAGKVDLRVERMDLRDACEGLLGLIGPLADRKGVQLVLEASDDLPVLRTDPRKFQQIIFNFLSNAVKFSHTADRAPTPPRIILRAERLPDAGADAVPRVRVSVIDNGPGIPKEEQDKIFEKFYQVRGGLEREQGGTGLGLAISKDLATILKGEVQVISDAGQGSMFSLIVPVSIDDVPIAGGPASSSRRASDSTELSTSAR